MSFYSFEMVLVGVILLSAMIMGGTRLWLKRRQISSEQSILNNDLKKEDTKIEKSTLDTKEN